MLVNELPFGKHEITDFPLNSGKRRHAGVSSRKEEDKGRLKKSRSPSSDVPCTSQQASAFPVRLFSGAGLGTRLRPLTDILPKPLIPFFHEPLILHSMRRCYDCGIREFIINTHHLAAAWDKVFPEHSWNGCPVHFSHEPVLLDSGGGVKKIEPLASAEEPLLVVNGDMAATFDLGRLLEEHLSRRPPVTLALRTSGDKKNVGFDFSSGLVTDMRHCPGPRPRILPIHRRVLYGAGNIPTHPFRGSRFHYSPVSGLHPGRTPARHSGGRRVVDGHGNTGGLSSSPSGFPIPRSTHPLPGQSVPPRLCGRPLRDRPRSCGRGRLPPARLRCLGRAYACLPALARNAGFSIVPPPITDDAFSAPASPDIVLFRAWFTQNTAFSPGRTDFCPCGTS